MQSEPQVFIFIGRSGCGKGTQVELFKQELEKRNAEKILHVESGGMLRDFVVGPSYTQKLSKQTIESGGLMPESIIICRWSQYLIDNFTGRENIIFDGAPRKINEAVILDGALRFYGITRYKVIYLHVSEKWATERLLARKRNDDNAEAIKKRMDWFETEVMQSVNFFRVDQHGEFIEIDGEQPIEAVQAEIAAKAFK